MSLRPWRSLYVRVPRAQRHEVVRFQEVEATIDGRKGNNCGAARRLEARMDGCGVSGESAEAKLKGKMKNCPYIQTLDRVTIHVVANLLLTPKQR